MEGTITRRKDDMPSFDTHDGWQILRACVFGALAQDVPCNSGVVQLQLRMTSGLSRVQQTIQALRSLMVPAQLNRGCSGCWLYVDALDSGSLCYVEEWATKSDLEREIRSTRFTRLLSVMEGAPMPPSLEFRFISRKLGLDYVESILLVGKKNPLTSDN